VVGNVWEWTDDCSNHDGAPTDGSARTTGDCSLRILRGGSWLFSAGFLRSASRLNTPEFRLYLLGFRVGRTFLAPICFFVLLGAWGESMHAFFAAAAVWRCRNLARHVTCRNATIWRDRVEGEHRADVVDRSRLTLKRPRHRCRYKIVWSKIVCAVFRPLASAASTVPMSRPR